MRTNSSIWKVGSIVGFCLTMMQFFVSYLDSATDYKLSFLSDFEPLFGIAWLLGLPSSFVFIIGWARSFTKGERISAAVLIFITPWIVLMIGYPIDGLSFHGASALVMLSIPITSILAIVLAAMAIHAGGSPRLDA